jgi:hypothetical protein
MEFGAAVSTTTAAFARTAAMADFYSILAQAVGALDPSTATPAGSFTIARGPR